MVPVMTADPHDPAYLDEKSVRDELTRVFDLCIGCRQCADLCSTFPALFELADRFDVPDAGRLTPAEQDRVTDTCFHCTHCVSACPCAPGRTEEPVDVSDLVLRATAMRRANGQLPARRRIAARLLGRTERTGRRAMARTSLTSRVARAQPGSFLRRSAAGLTGVSSERDVPRFARNRFSSWFRGRTGPPDRRRQRVAVMPTCLVEFQATATGGDVVAVLEHNGFDCSLTSVGCCGLPWLHSGESGRFAAVAARNVEALASEIRNGGDVVVVEPACADTIVRHYPAYVDPALRADANLVAAHTSDVPDLLMRQHRVAGGSDNGLDIDFTGEVPTRVAYHPAGPLARHGDGYVARDLIELTGAEVEVVSQRSGIESLWAFRADHDATAARETERLAESLGRGRHDVVVGDGHLSNEAIAARTGSVPVHPISLIARAYGIPERTDD